LGIPQCVVHSLYRSSTRGPEDDSVEPKHVAPLSYYMFYFTTVVFDGTSPAFYVTETTQFMHPPHQRLTNVDAVKYCFSTMHNRYIFLTRTNVDTPFALSSNPVHSTSVRN